MARIQSSFGLAVEVPALYTLDQYCALPSPVELPFVVGGASNLLFSTETIARPFIKADQHAVEISVDPRAENLVHVRAGGALIWHEFVLQMLALGLTGLENLSLIPGTVGAAPIQNIGAYGVEVCDCITRVEAVHLRTGERLQLSAQECQFGYRDSIFKRELKDAVLVTHVQFVLRKNGSLNTSYDTLARELAHYASETLTAKQVSDAVIAVRRVRLPDPDVIGNAGSFFKNPVLSAEKFAQLQAQYPSLKAYPQSDGQVKIAAGWLIEQAGMKGYTRGRAGTHEHQALVVVNRGGATGAEILAVARAVRDRVAEKFSVVLENEVRILDAYAHDIAL